MPSMLYVEDKVTVEDLRLLRSRVQARVPSEIPALDHVLRIYGKKTRVAQWNHDNLRDLQAPIVIALASNEGAAIAKTMHATSEEAGNPHASLPLAIGSRVMLRGNIRIECGPVNGALGTVRDIVWNSGVHWQAREAPVAVLVCFDHYSGPAGSFATGNHGDFLIPIFRSRCEFYRGPAMCARTQFPITTAVHKAQDITVIKAVMDITRAASQLNGKHLG
ncbi:hypothetical protein Z517_09209 [Fonsecaea pedrosoi CBS 271.37]|uniref:Unplaced genomic scaffold supercont1.6, whole genome shotgun sequence n=1 Tax=Fonsecaea pedrosoi CBS 271.37 TaxID=1442368 RepID=A0A0D2GDJ4_9EURO|nr:uncharacterized protein Z517_09209 [Fonsecaea pedrosoi CBS 271.37]KIW76765.1 hypothetical protein Z517_09209 [Fonsecaea pedrosoi CBS 271.37]